MKTAPHPLRNAPLKTGIAAGAATAALFDGSAAHARADGLKAQAEALRAAAADRQAQSQPAAPSLEANYDRAKALLAGGDVAGAMAGFRRVLAAEPQSVDAMNGLGITYDRMGRHDVARGWYEAALAVKPDAASVLSNLGYSLYLQGEHRQAIPFLQAALRSNDRTAMATAQRLLSLVHAELTAKAAHAPMLAAAPEVALVAAAEPAPALAPARAFASAAPVTQKLVVPEAPEQSAPKATAVLAPAPAPEPASARIELAANGEARLVLGGSAPAPQLVAALGEAATLVLVADRWTEQDDLRLQAQERARETQVQLAALRPEPAPIVRIEQPIARLEFVKNPELRADRPLLATLVTPTEAPVHKARKPSRTAATRVVQVTLPASLSLETLSAPLLPAPTPVLIAAPAAQAFADTEDRLQRAPAPDAVPGWLLAVRLAALTNTGPAPVAPLLLLGADGTTHAFDSDDNDLNRFAARLRATPDEDTPAARQAAVARLEALIERIRRA